MHFLLLADQSLMANVGAVALAQLRGLQAHLEPDKMSPMSVSPLPTLVPKSPTGSAIT